MVVATEDAAGRRCDSKVGVCSKKGLQVPAFSIADSS